MAAHTQGSSKRWAVPTGPGPALSLPRRSQGAAARRIRRVRTLAREPALAESSCRPVSAAPLPGRLAAREAPLLCSGVCRAVPPGSCAMTRSSNRLAATAAAVGGRNGAVALAPRVQAAAPTALGADLATRSTDEDDAGWVEEQYAWDSGVMVRRGAARRVVTLYSSRARAHPLRGACCDLDSRARATLADWGASGATRGCGLPHGSRAMRQRSCSERALPVAARGLRRRIQRPLDGPCTRVPGAPPCTAASRVRYAAWLGMCGALWRILPWHVPTLYALACTGSFDPARARALRLAPPRPPGVRLRRGAWPGRPRQAVPRVCYAPGGCSRAA